MRVDVISVQPSVMSHAPLTYEQRGRAQVCALHMDDKSHASIRVSGCQWLTVVDSE